MRGAQQVPLVAKEKSVTKVSQALLVHKVVLVGQENVASLVQVEQLGYLQTRVSEVNQVSMDHRDHQDRQVLEANLVLPETKVTQVKEVHLEHLERRVNQGYLGLREM